MAHKHTVLLVDDEENVLRALSRLIRKDGYNILTANNPLEALGVLHDNQVDLIISDQTMPGIKGLDFLKTVKTKYPETVRILLTGNSDTAMAITAINEGEVYRFLTKPWDGDEIKITIKQALQHHDLLQELKGVLKTANKQSSLLNALEAQHPGITKGAEGSSEEAYYISEEDLSTSLEELTGKYFSQEDEDKD